MIFLSRGVRILTEFFLILSQFTRLTDGQTDRRIYDRQDRVAYSD